MWKIIFSFVQRVSLVAVMTVGGVSHAGDTYSGDVDISFSGAEFVSMSPSVVLYPGEEVFFNIAGQVNVNHHNYEVRRCKYFGMKCWYEDRARPNFQSYKNFDIAVSLVDSAGNRVVEDKVFSGSNSETWNIDYPETFSRLTPVMVHAYISKHYDDGEIKDIDRKPCKGRPRNCSSGLLKVELNRVNSNKRKDKLERAIAQNSNSGALSALAPELFVSRDALDPLLLHTSTDKQAVQELFSEKMKDWVEKAGVPPQTRIVEVIKRAKQLHANPMQLTKLNKALMDSYAKQGRYEKVQAISGPAIDTARRVCADPFNCTLPNAVALADLYASSATGFLENRARMNAGDIQIAVNYYRAGIVALGQVLQKELDSAPPSEQANIESGVMSVAAILGEQARTLMIVRTRSDIDEAVNALEQSKCIWGELNAMPNNGISFNDWRDDLKKCVDAIVGGTE